VRADGTTQIVTTSDEGHLRIFSRSGTLLADLGAQIPATIVLLSKLSRSDPADTILTIGTQTPGTTVAVNAVSGDGRTRWSAALQSNINPAMVYSAAFAPQKPWLAVSLEGGQVFVLDAAQGTIVASIDGQTRLPEVAWITTPDKTASRLIVSTHDTMRAYNVTVR
jgi:WD40 repeat protein